MFLSLQRSYAERGVDRVLRGGRRRWWGWRGLLLRFRGVNGYIVEKSRGGHKKQVAGDGVAHIEQAVVIAGRIADEHVFEHPLRDARRAAIADKIRSELTVSGAAKRHVVAQNLKLPVEIYDPTLYYNKTRDRWIGTDIGADEKQAGR